MSHDFSSGLAEIDLDDVPKPSALPAGDSYTGVISKYEYRETATNKKILSYLVKVIDWSPEIAEGDRVDSLGTPVNLAMKSQRMDYFYESEDGKYALARFLKSCGLRGSLPTAVPQAVGQTVTFHLVQKLDEKKGNINTNIRSMKGPVDLSQS